METEISQDNLPNDECTIDLNLFFSKGLFNSCKATDELFKSIEESQDEALADQALAFYQRQYSRLRRPWENVTFMYGLGLIYMHYNAYDWAIKAFRETLYVQPSFPRSRDVHTRLGLLFKAICNYKLSEKHFSLALSDTRPESGYSSDDEIRFHLAHLLEIKGNICQAKDAYEKLLLNQDLPQQLSANIHRHLGWMYFCSDFDETNRKTPVFNPQNTSSNQRIDAALNYLDTSYRVDSDAKTSYYLGRCFTNIGKFQDAFASYRSVIDREESTADTWCSMGVLYHRQNQPTDALQAYMRSVQFDKQHAVAWMNLGILYESHNQFHDALKCYQHVLRCNAKGLDVSLQARIKYIQKHVTEVESSMSNNGKQRANSDKLLSIEDLWNLESKNCSANHETNTTKSKTALNNSEDAQTSDVVKSTDVLLKPLTDSISTGTKNDHNDHHHTDNQAIAHNHNHLANNKTSTDRSSSLLNHCANIDETAKQDIGGRFLLETNSIATSEPTSNLIGGLDDCKSQILAQCSQDSKPQLESKDFNLNQLLTNGASKDSGISSNSSTYADCALVPSQSSDISVDYHLSAEQVIEAHKNLPRYKRIDVNLLNDDGKPPHMFPQPPPYPPLPSDQLFPSPPSIFMETKKDLLGKKLQECCQSNPISVVRNLASVLKLDLGLFSTKTLLESNPDQKVDIVDYIHHTNDTFEDKSRNLWTSERQQSTSTISRYAGYQVSSFRESLREEGETKSSGSKINPTKESETDSNESASGAAKRLNNGPPNHEVNSNSSSQNTSINNSNNSKTTSANVEQHVNKRPSPKKFKRETSKTKSVKAADKIDLSDEKKWRSQLHELNKLPNFMRCVSASNMLTHVGPLHGVNTIAMSMHVPSCRILSNDTPNNFCTININVGPGDYEWCAISAEYKSVLTRLCIKNGHEYEKYNWWPKLNDLQKYNIPVYRFTQRPGDMVWVNSGTISWVQSLGWCNNIHWNIGPLSVKQFRSASESFELNKLLFKKSQVPMIQLTWNIIINIDFLTDEGLSHAVLGVLRRSLKFCVIVKELVDESKKEISYTNGEPGPKKAKYCSLCECEIFNISFEKIGDNSIHCVECARRHNTKFDDYGIRQDYHLDYLMKLYDKFVQTRRKFENH